MEWNDRERIRLEPKTKTNYYFSKYNRVLLYIPLSAAAVYSPRSAALRLFSRNTTVRTRRERKHYWSTKQYLELLRSHPKVNHPLWYYDVTCRDVTFGHVTSGSHATSGHAQWYILYYYYGKKKSAGMHFLAYAEHTSGYDVASGHMTSCDVISVQGLRRWRHFQ